MKKLLLISLLFTFALAGLKVVCFLYLFIFYLCAQTHNNMKHSITFLTLAAFVLFKNFLPTHIWHISFCSFLFFKWMNKSKRAKFSQRTLLSLHYDRCSHKKGAEL